MIEQVLGQAGTIYSDQQLQIAQEFAGQVPGTADRGRHGGCGSRVQQAQQNWHAGSVGQLCPGRRASRQLCQETRRAGPHRVDGGQRQAWARGHAIGGALALAETKRIYSALPPLKGDLVAAASAARTNPELRGALKLAEQLDEARDLLQKPAGQRRAVTALNRIIAENPGTPAAKMAGEWLQEQNRRRRSGRRRQDVSLVDQRPRDRDRGGRGELRLRRPGHQERPLRRSGNQHMSKEIQHVEERVEGENRLMIRMQSLARASPPQSP